jgi:type II secretory ATPase GspE/PulE/Tfp pilus assembly ATPase PilB-like protein
MIFGFFGKKKKGKDDVDDEREIEPVSFQGPINGQEVNLKAHAKLVEAGLVRAKDVVTDAMSLRADSLKVEPKGPGGLVTIYIDGIPQSGGKLSKAETLAVTQVMKLVAGLDSKERQAAQAGGLKAEFEGKKYLLRVSTSAVPEGERLMVRIQDTSQKLETLTEMGMGEPMRQRLREILVKPGVILAIGPPGSGTTTTMFGLLKNVDSYQYTVFSMVDPGGRTLFGVSSYDDKPAGESLEDSLVRLGRKEANVILVEPVKSAGVAKPVFGKAENLTLISEMPAKDTATAVTQLVQLVGDAGVVANGLKALVTQKMLRRLCPSCKSPYRPKPDFLKKLGLDESVKTLYRVPPPPEDPKEQIEPCEKCGDVGYFGRVAMFEVLEVTPGIQELIQKGGDPAALREQIKKEKQITLQKDGLRLVAEGVTSLEELQRVFKPA